MESIAFSPENKALQSLVDSYYLVSETEMREVSTIPNGRVDGAVVLEGTIEWFFPSTQSFAALPRCAFFGLSNTTNRARVPYPIRCISIKFFPHVLALPVFKGIRLTEPIAFDDVFQDASGEEQFIQHLQRASGSTAWLPVLEDYLIRHLVPDTRAKWLGTIIETIESSENTLTISELAKSSGVSVKTLERRFIGATGLTPKQYLRIIQLQKAARLIRKQTTGLNRGDLAESLGGGYYDQSHFVKACRSITGLTPKQLFTSLPDAMTDLIL